MVKRIYRIVIACASLQVLTSCRAMETSRCSQPDIVDTVKALAGENSDSPAALMFKAGNATFSLDAIRTVSTSDSTSVCEGRLTIEYHMLRDGKMVVGVPMGPMAGQAPVQETPEGRALREKMERQFATKEYEVTYKVEMTDDGKAYVTIVPSDADVRSQQDQQQQNQLRDQQFEQNQRDDAERQREYQQEQDDQRTKMGAAAATAGTASTARLTGCITPAFGRKLPDRSRERRSKKQTKAALTDFGAIARPIPDQRMSL